MPSPSQINSLVGPDWAFEIEHSARLSTVLQRPCTQICGVDEAGRGPLAGPVVAAAVIFPQNGTDSFLPDPNFNIEGLDDSKRLTDIKRDQLYDQITSTAYYGIGISEPEEIDRINILQASMIAMKRAIENLPVQADLALIDGNKTPPIDLPCVAIVKGDQKSLSIAAASIIAKVTRDRLMQSAQTRFPQYGLAGHKGYATKNHRESIQMHNPSPIHRFSFGTVRMMKDK